MKKVTRNFKKLDLNKVRIANIAEKNKVSGGAFVTGNDCLSGYLGCGTGEETGNNITFNDVDCNNIIA